MEGSKVSFQTRVFIAETKLGLGAGMRCKLRGSRVEWSMMI